MTDTILYILLGTVILLQLILALLLRRGKKGSGEEEKLAQRFENALSITRREISENTGSALKAFSDHQNTIFERQEKILEGVGKSQTDTLTAFRLTLEGSVKNMDNRLIELMNMQEKSAEALRKEVDSKLLEVRRSNEKNLAEIRASVEEKLQATLEDRIGRSFKEVSDRLEQVYKGLGEMQTLASGVGDLKRVLSNVKTRGILGEIQLGSILQEILAPEQYDTNVAVIKGSSNRVEFAVRLPGREDGKIVYLPIDSKFPLDAYRALQDAYDSADPDQIRRSRAELNTRITSFAKDIREKYVSPPDTTDFGIMFLPTEGLYAEIVNMGLIETLQQKYRVNIAGPTTMAALLNSLQTGFRTLAIQKRSSEVWEILGAVKVEFDKFESALVSAQNRIKQADDDIERLVGVRSRAIRRKLRSVGELPEQRAQELLKEENDGAE